MDEHITYVGWMFTRRRFRSLWHLETGAERFANTGRYRIRLRH